jgi:iron complex outermembrane receptor protein
MAPPLLRSRLRRTPARRHARALALARAALLGGAALPAFLHAQSTEPATLPAVSVTGRATVPPLDVGGFGDVPLERLPMQAVTIGESALREVGARGARDLSRFDASLGDAYNAVGYWDALTVRGFVIDQRYNFRRDGLPVSGETAIALDNKSRLELLKGTSGIQAGTSAPGGLVNYVVKRPDADLRSAYVELSGSSNALAAVDLSSRFGADRAFGLRLNAAAEHLDPELHDALGERHLLALAGDWRLSRDTLVEAEFELSRRSQPSQPGFSLLGDRVPSADDISARHNLNDQSWTQPVVFDGRYASLRVTQRLAEDWRAVLHAGTQRLRNDDRTAFPFGCTDGAIYYGDRFCPDGRFDLYDYRSEEERRRTHALDARIEGRAVTGPVSHALSAGVLVSRFKARLEDYAYNFVGQGTIDGNEQFPPMPDRVFTNTNRTERNTELYLRDALQAGPWGLWLGVRHTRLDREAVQTDGSGRSRYDQDLTAPWAALSWTASDADTFYASWGRGIESDVVPNLGDLYANPGATFTRKSKQTELGYKRHGEGHEAGLALFDIERPALGDFFLDDGRILRTPDGSQRHRGIEASAAARLDRWLVSGSAQWLRARREDSVDPAVDGNRPPNVPARSLRLLVAHEPVAVPGLRAQAALTAESDRTVLPSTESLRVPGWARIDLGASYEQTVSRGTRLVWRAAVDNVTDRRAWQESPYQFNHVYLYPMGPRTWRLSLQADL